jgi:hypothetical protein
MTLYYVQWKPMGMMVMGDGASLYFVQMSKSNKVLGMTCSPKFSGALFSPMQFSVELTYLVQTLQSLSRRTLQTIRPSSKMMRELSFFASFSSSTISFVGKGEGEDAMVDR